MENSSEALWAQSKVCSSRISLGLCARNHTLCNSSHLRKLHPLLHRAEDVYLLATLKAHLLLSPLLSFTFCVSKDLITTFKKAILCISDVTVPVCSRVPATNTSVGS